MKEKILVQDKILMGVSWSAAISTAIAGVQAVTKGDLVWASFVFLLAIANLYMGFDTYKEAKQEGKI